MMSFGTFDFWRFAEGSVSDGGRTLKRDAPGGDDAMTMRDGDRVREK